MLLTEPQRPHFKLGLHIDVPIKTIGGSKSFYAIAHNIIT